MPRQADGAVRNQGRRCGPVRGQDRIELLGDALKFGRTAYSSKVRAFVTRLHMRPDMRPGG